MKTSFIHIRALLAALACLSCTKAQMTEPESVTEETPTVPVTFRIGSGEASGTKMTGVTETYENRLEHWLCFVCAGDLEEAVDNGIGHSSLHFLSTDGNHAVCNLPVGRYTAFVIANENSYDYYEDADFIYDGIIFDGVSFDMFSPGSIYMTGYREFTVSADTRNVVTIHVQRIVGKIQLQRISVDFEDASYRTREVILRNIFLTNVTIWSQYFDFMEQSYGFYNKQGLRVRADAVTDSFVCDLDIGHTLQSAGGASRTAMTTPHIFYAFENMTSADEDSRDEVWCQRCTRLVVELLIDGTTHYYSVTIPELRRNYCYNISRMTITGPGSADPERDVPNSVEVTFSPAYDGWDSIFTIHEES